MSIEKRVVLAFVAAAASFSSVAGAVDCVSAKKGFGQFPQDSITSCTTARGTARSNGRVFPDGVRNISVSINNGNGGRRAIGRGFRSNGNWIFACTASTAAVAAGSSGVTCQPAATHSATLSTEVPLCVPPQVGDPFTDCAG